jgi:hypothetical protein
MTESTGDTERHRGRGPRQARPLTSREGALLDFERDWQVHHGRKTDAIRERFGISAARYYQLLTRLVDRPAAAEYDPLVVARLRRRRDPRLRARAPPPRRVGPCPAGTPTRTVVHSGGRSAPRP